MRAFLLALIVISASWPTTAAPVETLDRIAPTTYPFDIERSRRIGDTFDVKRGEVVYSETSRGRPAAFLTSPFRDPVSSVRLAVDDPLFPLSFKNRSGGVVSFLCASKFANLVARPYGNVRPTICFR